MSRNLLFGVVISAAGLSGCQSMNHTGAGAALGTGLGAVTGAVIGGDSGHAAGGALIGAAAGAVTGGLVGNAMDAREERDAAIAHAQYEQARSQALTTSDVVSMSRNGVSDEVIANSVRTRGVRFDGSPEAIIQLKQQGVSDRVIAAMQANATSLPVAGPAVPAYAYVAPAPPPAVVVVGGPRPGPYWGPPPPRYWGPRYRRYGW